MPRGGSRKRRRTATTDPRLEDSYFSGAKINYRTPCTSSEGNPCDIFKDISIWNEYFLQAGLELRELSPAELSLVEVDDAFVPLELAERKHEAATLLRYLLTHHRCLVSVVLNSCIFGYHKKLCDALPKSPGLRKLTLFLPYASKKDLLSFSSVLPLLTRLQELECRLTNLDRPLCEGISKFLANAGSLRTLRLSAQRLESGDGTLILEGLRRHAAITTLSLNMTIVNAFLSPNSATFTDYLSENRTIRKLIVKSYYPDKDADLHRVLRSLFRTSTISELELTRFTLSDATSGLVAELIGENRSLRVLRMVDCFLYGDGRTCGRIAPWLSALAENDTLEELTMELACFSLNECRSLFKALKSNASLKNITVESIRSEDMAGICRALRGKGVRGLFRFGRHHVVREPAVPLLTECEELSRVTIDSAVLYRPDQLRTALSLLPSCSHVTSLILAVWQPLFNRDVCGLIAQYISATTVLRELKMTLASIYSYPADRIERALMGALCVNKSVRRLSMTGLRFDETEVQMLVDKLQAGRTIYELTFYPDDYNSTIWLVQKLSPIISSNYTLVGMQVYRHVILRADLFSVDDAVRRNAALVSRAAHFVTEEKLRYCAAAVELVRWSPALVAKVQALACVDENAAVARISEIYKGFYELDGFMRAAGVVRYSVVCHVLGDGQKQLVDIDGDCWWHIRRYLEIDDIVD
ncbi:hypothetical protein MTO96_002173 [Rhipicephalus appendiculatus]